MICMSVVDFAVPGTIAGILLYGCCKKIDVFSVFIEGAKQGLVTIKNIFPVLVGLFTLIYMMQASGAVDLLSYMLQPLTNLLGVPAEVMPLALLRPISGSGALSVCQTILTQYHPDSFIGQVASVLQGSSETTFYVITVYFGAIGVKKTKYAIPAALIGDFVGLICSAWFVQILLK